LRKRQELEHQLESLRGWDTSHNSELEVSTGQLSSTTTSEGEEGPLARLLVSLEARIGRQELSSQSAGSVSTISPQSLRKERGRSNRDRYRYTGSRVHPEDVKIPVTVFLSEVFVVEKLMLKI
jgi:hypothetical protein